MVTCSFCGGKGYCYYDDGEHRGNDACYHCGTTGKVSEDVDFSDRLMQVAYTIAYAKEKAYRKYCDEDPDGDGYALHAAENMLSEHDYFMERVYVSQHFFLKEIESLSFEMKQVLVAWNEYKLRIIK